jgi:hypothetical protein
LDDPAAGYCVIFFWSRAAADSQNAGVGKPDDDLIKTSAGEPSDGFGVAYRRWALSHAPAAALTHN